MAAPYQFVFVGARKTLADHAHSNDLLSSHLLPPMPPLNPRFVSRPYQIERHPRHGICEKCKGNPGTLGRVTGYLCKECRHLRKKEYDREAFEKRTDEHKKRSRRKQKAEMKRQEQEMLKKKHEKEMLEERTQMQLLEKNTQEETLAAAEALAMLKYAPVQSESNAVEPRSEVVVASLPIGERSKVRNIVSSPLLSGGFSESGRRGCISRCVACKNLFGGGAVAPDKKCAQCAKR